MNCDCITTTQMKLHERLDTGTVKLKGKAASVLRVRLANRLLLADSLQDSISIPFHVYVEGKKKPIELPVIASYCPFCGKATAVANGEEGK